MHIPWHKILRIFVFLVWLESFFWIGGAITQFLQFYGNKQKLKTHAAYVILCIGDSFTLVGEEDSYPSQLQKILDARFGKNKFQVINQGEAGKDTKFFREQLPGWIKSYRPDMVIAMIGILDSLSGPAEKQSLRSSPLGKIKLYNLTLLLINNGQAGWNFYLKRVNERFFPPKKDGPLSPTKNPSKKINPEAQKQVVRLVTLAQRLENKQKYKEAELIYKNLLNLNNLFPLLNQSAINGKVGQLVLLQKEYERFVDMMKDVPPYAWGTDWIQPYCHGEKHTERIREIIESVFKEKLMDDRAYGNIAACYAENGQKDLAEKYFVEFQERNDNYRSDLTKTNYRAILKTLVDNNIQPVFLQYPMRPLNFLQRIFKLENQHEKIIFVDNGTLFLDLFQKDYYAVYFSDRANGDIGHLTPEGNYRLAKNIAQEIFKHLCPFSTCP